MRRPAIARANFYAGEGFSRFRHRRQPYFGGGEGQPCQFFLHPRGHLLLFRQDDCRIPAPLRLSSPPRFKIRALGLSFRKKQDIIAVYLVKKESKGFLN